MAPETAQNAFQPPAKRGETSIPAGSNPVSQRETIVRLHEIYNAKTGAAVRLRHEWEAAWGRLLQDYDWDGPKLANDLQLVIRHLNKQIDKEKRNPGCLKLRNLLDPGQFEEDVNEARIILKPGKPRPAPVAVTTTLADGSTVTRAAMSDPGKHEPVPVAGLVAGFRKQMGYPEGKDNA